LYFFSSSPVNALALQKHKFSGEKSPWNPMCRYFWSPLYTIMIIQRSVKLTVPVSVYFVWKHVPPLSWPTVQSTPKVTVHWYPGTFFPRKFVLVTLMHKVTECRCDNLDLLWHHQHKFSSKKCSQNSMYRHFWRRLYKNRRLFLPFINYVRF